MTSYHPSKHPIRKRHALLLELIIAFFLVSLCLIPLLKPHLFIRKELCKRQERMQLERIAKIAAADVKAYLFACNEPWTQLKKGNVTGKLTYSFHRVNGGVSPCTCSFQLFCKRAYNNKQAHADYLLMELKIVFDDFPKEAPYTSLLFLQKCPEGTLA